MGRIRWKNKFGQVKGDEHQPQNTDIHKNFKHQHAHALSFSCIFHEFGVALEDIFLAYFLIAGASLASVGVPGDSGDPVVELFCHLGEHIAVPREAQASQKTGRKVPASVFC